MNARQALKEAQRRWGKTAGVQEQKNCDATPESRAAARARLLELNALCTTPELRKQYRKERDDALSRSHWHRFTVGYIALGIAFAVQGQGDTWEEAFKAAEKKR